MYSLSAHSQLVSKQAMIHKISMHKHVSEYSMNPQVSWQAFSEVCHAESIC